MVYYRIFSTEDTFKRCSRIVLTKIFQNCSSNRSCICMCIQHAFELQPMMSSSRPLSGQSLAAIHRSISARSIARCWRYHGPDPWHVIGYTGVDAILAPSAAAVPETGHTGYRPPATYPAQQRSAWVARTSVGPAVFVARTEHIVRDQVPPVRGPADSLSHDGHLLTTRIGACLGVRTRRWWSVINII